jgi:hypothetical protein
MSYTGVKNLDFNLPDHKPQLATAVTPSPSAPYVTTSHALTCDRGFAVATVTQRPVLKPAHGETLVRVTLQPINPVEALCLSGAMHTPFPLLRSHAEGAFGWTRPGIQPRRMRT